MEIFSFSGLVLAVVILFKLFMQGKSINFINIMFINVFLYEVIGSGLIIHRFMSVAQGTWNEPNPKESIDDCGIWWDYKQYYFH